MLKVDRPNSVQRMEGRRWRNGGGWGESSRASECRQRCRKTSRLGLEAGCLGRLAELDLDPPIIDLKRSNQNNLGCPVLSMLLK
jgi:hypothetical protein